MIEKLGLWLECEDGELERVDEEFIYGSAAGINLEVLSWGGASGI